MARDFLSRCVGGATVLSLTPQASCSSYAPADWLSLTLSSRFSPSTAPSAKTRACAASAAASTQRRPASSGRPSIVRRPFEAESDVDQVSGSPARCDRSANPSRSMLTVGGSCSRRPRSSRATGSGHRLGRASWAGRSVVCSTRALSGRATACDQAVDHVKGDVRSTRSNSKWQRHLLDASRAHVLTCIA